MPSVTRSNLALAASFAALVIAAPLAFKVIYDARQPELSSAVVAAKSAADKPAPASQPVAARRTAAPLVNPELLAKPAPPPPSPSPAAPGVLRERFALGGEGKRDSGRIAPPLDIGRQELALKGADPGRPQGYSPTDGVAAPAPPFTPGGAIGGVQQSAANLDLTGSMLGTNDGQPVLGAPPPAAPGASYSAAKAYAPRAALGASGIAYDQRRAVTGIVRLDQDEPAQRATHDDNRDKFDGKDINPVKQVATEPVSTFSIDVDTASYSFVRRALNAGELPPKDAVRVEELINYFPYDYPAPATADVPFKPSVTVMPSPWNVANRLVHIAVKGYDLKSAERPRANLVFLIDVSGSMEGEDRLPLVKNAFRLLLDQLRPDDTVGIVTYAGESGIALEPTKVREKSKILSAIDVLGAAGSTAGGAGIQDAYRLAEADFDKAAVNRVILATDGDFNVGITDQAQLKGLIERKRQTGIFLSVLGVGHGNHNDALMQALAQNGNGTAAYVDTLNEARKVLVDESSSTLFPIAKDVKLQIEWNPERVSEYRLIGYETRALAREDFNNDRVDAGDIGSGHTVTAIYEVTPVGAPRLVDDLRYGRKLATAAEADVPKPQAVKAKPESSAELASEEMGFLKLRYKRPNEDASQLIEVPINNAAIVDSVTNAPEDVRFSVAVAAFGQLLRGAPYTMGYGYDDVLALAQPARGADPFGYRSEFLNLVRLAKSARP